jgi:hypothetical protein
LDCFTKDEPFTNSFGSLPESPGEIHIKLHLFNRNHPRKGSELVYNDPQSIVQSGYDSTKPLKFLIHGYMSEGDADWVINMTNSLLQRVICLFIKEVTRLDKANKAAESIQ